MENLGVERVRIYHGLCLPIPVTCRRDEGLWIEWVVLVQRH